MIYFSFHNWIFIITLVIIIDGCFDCLKNGSSNFSIHSLDESEHKLNNVNMAEISGSEDFQLKLWQKGVDFYARGNEPFWSLDMDFEKGFYFKTLNGIEINTAPVEGVKAMDANIIRFYTETDSGTLVITVSEIECNDTMSDEVFPNKVKIEVKQSAGEQFQIFEGCGRYVADYGLHDIWALTDVNGKDLQSGDLKEKRLPMIEFFAKEGKVLGNTGCNDFNGNYYISGIKEIQFGEITMTKKMCTEMEIENLLIKYVFGRRMKYAKENLSLKLTGYDGTELILKKID